MYKKNFISEVIIRLDYSSLMEYDLKTLRKISRSRSFDYKEEPINTYQFNLIDPRKTKIRQEGIRISLKQSDDNKVWFFEPKSYSYSSKKFDKRETFFDEFNTGFEIVNNNSRNIKFSRVGFRIINKIWVDEIKKLSDWKNYINHDYISNYGDSLPPSHDNFSLRRKMNSTILSDGKFILSVNVGIFNDNFPGIIADKHEFILDLDCYIDNLILDRTEVNSYLPEMCKILYDFFGHIVTVKMKNKMKKLK